MTSQTGKNRRGWRRTFTTGVAISAVAAGIMAGFAAPTALADPADPATPTDTPPTPTMTADEALAIIATEYDTGAGGGQLSNLIHEVLKLRALGFKPSNANKIAIQEALDKRPNQAPLVEALQETIVYQRKLQAQLQNSNTGQNPYLWGIGQPPPGMGPTQPPGVPPDPGDQNGVYIGGGGTTINQPVG
jgi:hypothetical protein